MFFTASLALRPALAAQSVKSDRPQKQAGANKCTSVKFHALGRYKGERWSKVFSDREVVPVLKLVLKGNYGKLESSLERVNYPDSLSFVDSNGILTLEGGVPGLYTIMEAKLIVEPCGNLYVGILDEGERFLYFSNDRNYTDKLHPIIDEWRSDVEKRRRDGLSKPNSDLPVIFKSK